MLDKDDTANDHRQYDAAMRWQLLLAGNPDLAAKDAQVKAELAMAEDYDFSGECEPSCSCYRAECPELFCDDCNKALPLDFIKARFPDFTDYCTCAEVLDA